MLHAPHGDGCGSQAIETYKQSGGVRDVKQLAGHASMQTMQRYIEGDAAAKCRLVHLV
jgi:site-specific recombinase XerC